jgi:LPS sulfotransferase NodH
MLTKRRVFILGSARTGTTSLCLYLAEAGLRAIHYYPDKTGYIEGGNPAGNKRRFIAFVDGAPYDAFGDHPTRLYFRELSELYPDAYFVLTLRSSVHVWRESASRYFSEIGANVDIDEAELDYLVNNAIISAFFSSRNLKLHTLVIDRDSRENAEALRLFLEMPDAPGEIPKSNRAPESEQLTASPQKNLIEEGEIKFSPLTDWLTDCDVGPALDRVAGGKEKRYIVAVTPGARDYLLCKCLASAGLGFAHHFANDGFWSDYLRLLPGSSHADFLEFVYRNYAGPTKVLGMAADYHRLASLDSFAPSLAKMFKDPHYVFYGYRDILRQAASFYRSSISGVWGGAIANGFDPSKEVVFDACAILECLKTIIFQEIQLFRLFRKFGIRPLVVWAESLIAAPADVCTAVAAHLGMESIFLELYPRSYWADELERFEGSDREWENRLWNTFPELDSILACRPNWLSISKVTEPISQPSA